MAREKPGKPYPDFPLFPHPNGQWSKKINGRPHYFGRWEEPDAALAKYLEQRDDLYAGRVPRKSAGGITVRHAINSFLEAKETLLESGELSGHSWDMYQATCEIIADKMVLTRCVADLQPSDFLELRAKLAKGVGLITLGIRIRIARMVFKFAYDADLIDKPVRFGPTFRAPSKLSLRVEKNSRPKRMLEAEEVRKLIAASSAPFRAMILLGVNCGFGNTDVATLPYQVLDLEGGWVTFPRPKTGMPRRCPLWPETVKAIQDAIALGRKAKNAKDRHLVFLTVRGERYVRRYESGGRLDGLGQKFGKLLVELKMNRTGVRFYTLRHVFETIGGDSGDQIAVNHIMGHAPKATDMAAQYRERIDDRRLRDVTNYVRAWLWPDR